MRLRIHAHHAAFLSAVYFLLGLAGVANTATPAPTDPKSHWAFQPPGPVALPAVQNTNWPRTALDRFILARLEAVGAEPAPAADPRTLVRRMTLDMTGLPPTPEEVDRFVEDCRRARSIELSPPLLNRGQPLPESAISDLIERLLARPAYGERWGRHWLDIARYSDTKGYVYAREERRFVHSPTYRDWVIRAFNEDLPYDRFLLLQMAADQMADPDSPDLAAMGFLTGGRRFIGVTHDIIDDRIDVVTRGTMALTVQCARCHDHKYDPIPIQDYYSLYGVFHGCDDKLTPLSEINDAELAKRRQILDEAMSKHREEAAQRLRQRVGEYLTAQLELEKYPEEGFDQILSADDIIPASVRRWRDFLHTSASRDSVQSILGPWLAVAALSESEFAASGAATLASALRSPGIHPWILRAFTSAPPPKSMREVSERYGRIFTEAETQPETPETAVLRAFLRDPDSPTVVPETGIINNEAFFPTSVTESLWKLQGDVDRRLIELGVPAALIVADRQPGPNPRVFKRGSPSRLGESVPRQFLGILAGPERKPFEHGSGRLELARAIAHPNNPLTARVMVNRLWQHHFGVGLVRTASDFGLRAEPPTHPELLDWLALRFMSEGWSIKAMHRLILASAVYQQSSRPFSPAPAPPATARPDTIAHTTPLIQAKSRSPVRPPGPPAPYASFPVRRLDFEQLRDSMLFVSGELDPAVGGRSADLLDGGNRRRSVYGFVDRQFLPGVLRTFDFANPDIHVAVRYETTVPQQALYFLNGSFAAQRAKALAAATDSLAAPERIRRLYSLLFQRTPTERDVATGLRFLADVAADPPPAPPPVRETPWRYGTGEYDSTRHQLKSFVALPYFSGESWQGAANWPGGATGWAQLTAEGGHPGNTLAHGCIRRWVAPIDAVVRITGSLHHEPEPGDGVRAFIVSSRQGELKSANIHHAEVDMGLNDMSVKAGETIDFIVDIGGTLNSDQFKWAPKITSAEQAWDARKDFTGPKPEPTYLAPWEQYVQVLLLSNEFAFLD
ncbi:MAG: DUF1553 domain-containing protein [Verrucomicrobiales bacterium]|nr:DUF1553 domain-containing protein [Verrucomicrobiales bacterium]